MIVVARHLDWHVPDMLEKPGRITTMAHMSRLTLALQTLLHTQRVAALGSIHVDGTPLVSMVPYAIDPVSARLVIHVSGLAAHTNNMLRTPGVSLMVMRAEVAGAPVHALERVTFQGQARVPEPDSPAWLSACGAYVGRFPEALDMLQLGDFRFVSIAPTQARHVAGFGAARSVDQRELQLLLADDSAAGRAL